MFMMQGVLAHLIAVVSLIKLASATTVVQVAGVRAAVSPRSVEEGVAAVWKPAAIELWSSSQALQTLH